MEDTILSLLDLNRTKLHLLNHMKKLEETRQTEEFIQMIDLYEFICNKINQKLESVDASLKDEYGKQLISLNDGFYNEKVKGNENLIDFLSFSESKRIVLRTIFDLCNNSIPVTFYQPTNNHPSFDIPLKDILSLFGITTEEKSFLNTEAINQYMVRDFIQTFYSIIELNLEKSNSRTKKRLLSLKYNAIFLYQTIENRCLMYKFCTGTQPNLTDIATIEQAGISLKDYLSSITSAAQKRYNNSFDEIMKSITKDNFSFSLVDQLYRETCLALVSDKSKIKCSNTLNILLNSIDINAQVKKALLQDNDDRKKFSKKEYQYRRKYISK